MKATHRHGGWASLLALGAVLAGCGRGGSGPAELFLDSMLSAILTSEAPELWVSLVSGPPSATSGTGYFVTVKACNQGTASASSTVELRLSSDTSITATDALVGSAPTGVLHPEQCATLHVQTRGSVHVPPGLWYLGAIIDPSNSVSEGAETNNTRVGPRMAIGSGADLHLSAVSAPASLSPSARFTTAVTVCNTGTASASADVEVYLSEDSSITEADVLVGSGSTGPLREGQCTALAIPSEARVPGGQWYVAAWVDRANSVPELVEGNNTWLGSLLAVGSGPDFVLSEVSGPASIPSSPSSPITLIATVCNQGSQGASTSVEAFLSADTTLSTEDVLVGSASVSYLEPGQCAPVSISGSASVSRGRWHLAAWVDRANDVPELVESNNIRLGDRAQVGNGPDLSVSVVRGPSSVARAQPMSATATVCNPGTSSSPAASAALYLSRDSSIDTADALLGNALVPGLRPGECVPVELSGLADVDEGAWYVGVFVDSSHGVAELAESNNIRAGDIVAVGGGADLSVASVTGPAHLQSGQSFTGNVTVCNQGTWPTRASSRVGLFLSRDTSITAADLLIGEASLPSLQVGQCATTSVQGGAWVPEGTWYLGAIADLHGGEPELLEDNNHRAGSVLTLGDGSDFTLTAFRAPTRHSPG